MAEKKTKKQKIRKIAKRNVKPPVKKTHVKTKPKTAQKRKTASRKSVAKKTPAKKTTVKKKTKPVSKRKTAVAKRPVSKKPSRKPKSAPKKEMAVKHHGSFRRTTSKESEEERQAALRRTLIRKREEIVKEAKTEISKYIKGETRQLVDTALDDGDWSVVDLSEDVSLKQLATHRETLLKIDEALRKLNEGTYGLCEDCSEEIGKERLKILPFATYCIDCQEKREKFEEMEKREGLLS